jgi:hypothetical protein
MDSVNGNKELSPEAIMRVIAFFDLFDRPLSAWEISQAIDPSPTLDVLLPALEKDVFWRQQDGFYFLPGREEIIASRRERHNYSQKKIKRARFFARLFAVCPAVRAVFLANSLGSFNLRAGSDIDFFIITSPGKIWLSRLYCASLAKVLGVRPTRDRKKDKICLSFYVSENQLNLNSLFLPGGDPYFHFWRQSLQLLYNKGETAEKFFKSNEPGALQKEPVRPAVAGRIENLARRFQLAIMPARLKAAARDGNGVNLGDDIIKLYLSDRRLEYREKYGNKISQILAARR